MPDETAVRTAIDAVNEELVGCWNAGEYECMAAAFTQDGWQMMPNAKIFGLTPGNTDLVQYRNGLIY